MNLCFKVFHIPGLGASAQIRFTLSNLIKNYLSLDFKELESPTIYISNQQQYDEFNKDHGLLNPTLDFKYGELGVWASNLLAMKNFLNTDYDYLMLMEDDINFSAGFTPLLKQYMSELPKDWDLFSYFCHTNQNSRYTGNLQEGLNIVPAYQDWSMLCYVVNKRGAKKILDSVKETGITMPIDWYIFRQPDRFKSYTPAPYAKRNPELYETTSTFQHIDERVKINA
jgi:hypothetical protein